MDRGATATVHSRAIALRPAAMGDANAADEDANAAAAVAAVGGGDDGGDGDGDGFAHGRSEAKQSSSWQPSSKAVKQQKRQTDRVLYSRVQSCPVGGIWTCRGPTDERCEEKKTQRREAQHCTVCTVLRTVLIRPLGGTVASGKELTFQGSGGREWAADEINFPSGIPRQDMPACSTAVAVRRVSQRLGQRGDRQAAEGHDRESGKSSVRSTASIPSRTTCAAQARAGVCLSAVCATSCSVIG